MGPAPLSHEDARQTRQQSIESGTGKDTVSGLQVG